jgi:MFS family permease
MAALGFNAGVIPGGILAETHSWHGIFFTNVPLGAVAIVYGFLLVSRPARYQEKGALM